jgi:predicted small integral membrane protein
MPVVRLAKVLMTAMLASFAFIVTYDNLVDYGSNYEFVKHVLSMDTTFPGNALMDRAITSPAVWMMAYAGLIAGEGLTCILLTVGTVTLARALRRPAAEFNGAKAWMIAGATAGFGVWFFAFMVGGEFFAMWQSKIWNGQEAAFRFYMALIGVLIFVNQADTDPA